MSKEKAEKIGRIVKIRGTLRQKQKMINKKAKRFLLLSFSSDKKGTVKEDSITLMCVCLFIFKKNSTKETLHNQGLVLAATNNHNFIVSLGFFHTQLLTESKLAPLSICDLLLA